MRRWLRRLHDELHISSIFVTHDQEEALEVADRIVLMNKGRVEQIGNPREIYAEPATSFAYSFIGNVNEFRGKVEGDFVRVGGDLLAHDRNDLTDGAPGRRLRPAARHRNSARRGWSVRELPPRSTAFSTAAPFPASNSIANGGARDGRTDYFEVELTPAEIAALGLEAGKRVRINSRRLNVFRDRTMKEDAHSEFPAAPNYPRNRAAEFQPDRSCQRALHVAIRRLQAYQGSRGRTRRRTFCAQGQAAAGLTEPGQELVGIVERILLDTQNIKKLGEQFSNKDKGQLSVATTHTQARYALPKVVTQFKKEFPKVNLVLHEASPTEIVSMLLDGQADIGIATEALQDVRQNSRPSPITPGIMAWSCQPGIRSRRRRS